LGLCSNLSDVFLLLGRKMMMMRMMVELLDLWLSVKVKEVKKVLLETVGLLGFQMVKSVTPIWPICRLQLLVLLLVLPP
jgi:hypothetical protein